MRAPLIDASLRKIGFRRWYERQLIEAHVWLVTGLLAIIMLLIALETLDFGSSAANVLALVLVALAGGGIALLAWRRFSSMMVRAEAIARQATCGSCQAYGVFDVMEARDDPESASGRLMSVKCRRCSHGWWMG